MIRGLNMEKGLNNTGGDVIFYTSLIQDFFETYSNHADKIVDLVSIGDYRSAEIEAHSLKGTSNMLGFEKVYDIAFKMEMALKEKCREEFDCLIQPLKDELKSLYNDFEHSDFIKKKHEQDLSLKLTEKNKKILFDKLNALVPVIQSGRYEAETLVKQLLNDYAVFGLKKKLFELKSMIEQLDFEEALVLIKNIREEL